MRKVSLILAVVLFTVPAWASVTIICTPGTPDHNNVLVSYDSTTEAKKVRAFALDITVTNGTITAVDDTVNAWYKIYPGSIVIVDGNVTDWGTAVADPCDLPSDTKGGIGSSGITIEMGALYSPPDDAHGPPHSGNLIRFRVTPVNPHADSVVTIVENSSRGGVVLTDPNLNPTVVAPGCVCVRVVCCDEYPACKPDYAQWVAVNKPTCWWAGGRQCHGDADYTSEYVKGKGYYYVHFKDLGILLTAWNVREPPQGPGIAWPPNICADFDHDKEYIKGKGYYRVHFKDMGILLANWNVREPPQGPGVPRNCLDCP